MARPIDMRDTVWIEDLTTLEVRDLIKGGKTTALILTGGIAYNPYTREILEKHLGFIAPITVYPGEDELLDLCQGALRVVTGEEKAREY